MQTHEFWTWIIGRLNQQKTLCLVTMMAATGSGPNRPGSRMAVASDGERTGTVGGGQSEFMLVEMASEMLKSGDNEKTRIITLEHTEDTTRLLSGMICDGSQTFSLIILTPADLPTLRRITQSCLTNQAGKLILTKSGFKFSEVSSNDPAIIFDPNIWRYEEMIGIADTAFLIGGGHVSLALTPLLHSLGMRVVVLDNRPDLDTMKSNHLADETRTIDYNQITGHIKPGSHSYVCIMTFGHVYDEEVLKKLFPMDLRYLGMMGSRHKIKKIFDHLLADGFSQAELDKVHAPIGIPIESNTPEEIAISIAAQIIAVRRGILN